MALSFESAEPVLALEELRIGRHQIDFDTLKRAQYSTLDGGY